jgi:hypothetical protein
VLADRLLDAIRVATAGEALLAPVIIRRLVQVRCVRRPAERRPFFRSTDESPCT